RPTAIGSSTISTGRTCPLFPRKRRGGMHEADSRPRLTVVVRAAIGFGAMSDDTDRLLSPHHGIDVSARDATIRPQDDLFRHVNGRWLAEHVIPDDRATDGTFHRLRDRSEEHVREIVENLSRSDHDRGSIEQRIADLYASFMDEDRIESLDAAPLDDDMARIRAVGDRPAFMEVLGRFARVGGPSAFDPAVFPDVADPKRYGLYLTQGGLGLPDEAFYREDQFEPIRTAYVQHIAAMLALIGVADGPDAAGRIMALET